MQPAKIEPQLIRTTAEIGAIVRKQRRKQSVRIDDAAALVGVSVDLFSRLENGKGGVRLDKLLTVLDGMGLSMVVAPKDAPIFLQLRMIGISSPESASTCTTENAGK
jgi:transcriptional regulator with XRE-family HTH domain